MVMSVNATGDHHSWVGDEDSGILTLNVDITFEYYPPKLARISPIITGKFRKPIIPFLSLDKRKF